MGILVGVLVTGVTIAGSLWSYLQLSDDLLREEFSMQRGAAELASVHFVTGIESMRNDVAFLANIPAVKGILRARQNGGMDPLLRITEEQWKSRVVELFETRVQVVRAYMQISLIEFEKGTRESLRVERTASGVIAVPDSQLRDESHLAFFEEARQTPAGAVYLSRIQLNEDENGHILPERIPILRVATIINDWDGKPYGMMVIKGDLRRRFASMLSGIPARYKLYLFDENLDFLLHPDDTKSFGFQVGQAYRLTQQFPEMRTILAGGDRSQVVMKGLDGQTDLVASLARVQPDSGVSSRSYGVLVTANYDEVIAPSVQQRNQTLLFTLPLLFLTVGVVYLGSKRISRPLRRMTKAVQSFPQSAEDLDLPVTAGDEAGVLARAFREMFHQVRQHEADLQAQVAERRAAEDALRESEQRLLLALGAAQAGVWEWDLSTDQIAADDRIEEGAAIDKRTFRSTIENWLKLIHPEDQHLVLAAKRRAIDENVPFHVEIRIRGRNNDWRDWTSRGTLVRGEDGTPKRITGVCWDVTESKHTQEQVRLYAAELERKNREMEQFVYSVSHDLKSPLVTCKGFTGILKEDLADGHVKEAMECATRLERATNHMGRLIEDLLQLSRVGRVLNKSEAVDIAQLVRETAESIRESLQARHVDLDIDETMPVITADPLAMSRLFQNLIANAFKYGCSNPNSRISIGCRLTSDEARYFVRDNGMGIAPEYHEKIFGLFQRLEANQEGTGIGLAVVSKIMEVHNGRAWVESAPGAGSTFWLAFPIRLIDQVEPLSVRSSA